MNDTTRLPQRRARLGPQSDGPVHTRRIKTPKMAETIAGDLRAMIVRGELEEGSRLPSEADLMAEYGISRPTLREAIRILESESLLSITRGSREGARVNRPDVGVAARYFGLILQSQGTPLTDLYRARALLEPPAARIVATEASDRAPALLRAVLADARATIDDNTHVGRSTVRFHATLVELTGNETLILFMRMLHEIFERHISAVTIAAAERFDNTALKRRGLRSSEKLVDLIEAGDGDKAESFWRLHLDNFNRGIFVDQQFQRVTDVL